jgi:septum formation protein
MTDQVQLPVRLVLASGSPARLRVLRQSGIDPEVIVSGVDESIESIESTEDLDTPGVVAVLAERKASVVAPSRVGSLVLGCDSMLDLDGTALGKPVSPREATEIWARLAGREATLYTGHCLVSPWGASLTEVAGTSVRFGRPTSEEIAAYVSSGEPEELAGAFSIDGLGAPFVDGIDGDASNVLGLSLPLLRRMLTTFGIRMFNLWRSPTQSLR